VTEPRPRSWLKVRLRQARNPPPPIFRAVVANLSVAVVGGLALLAYDVLLSHGTALPGGDLRTALGALYVLVVMVVGSVVTYLWVELPTGASGARRRSWWSGFLGLIASLPIVYLVLVVIFQVIRPLIS
jgi:hypothetical protein